MVVGNGGAPNIPGMDLAVLIAAVIAELNSTAAVEREVDRGGRLHQVRGGRAVSAQAAQQGRGLGLLVRGNEGVLRRLAGLELERLILRGQSADLILSQEVQDAAGAVVDRLAGLAGLGGHVVAHLSDGRAVLAAAVRQLMAQVAEAAFHAVEALHHAHVGVVAEAINKSPTFAACPAYVPAVIIL